MCREEALCSAFCAMIQVDEAAPLWGAGPVRGSCESQSAAAAEALRSHWEEVEQPPPDLQVGYLLPRTASPQGISQRLLTPLSPGLRPQISQWPCLEGFLSQQPTPGCPAQTVPPCSHADGTGQSHTLGNLPPEKVRTLRAASALSFTPHPPPASSPRLASPP